MEKRIFDLNSLYGRHGTFQAPGGRCYGIAAYHKNGMNDGNLPWLLTSGDWTTGAPKGTGSWFYRFDESGSSRRIEIAVR